MNYSKIPIATVTDIRLEAAVVFLLSCALWGLNALWLSRDTEPPVWDMAVHQTYALNYLPNSDPPPNTRFWERSGNYPPFVHIVIALTFRLFHPGPHVAILANIPATLLLLWGVYEIGLAFAGIGAAAWACVLTTLTPFLIWISRETLLDYWLAAWVAVALALLLKTSAFESRPYSLVLGLTWALGMLTKWMFASFVIGSIAYVIMRHHIWTSRTRTINCTAAIGIAAVLTGVWYLPNLQKLIRFYFENAVAGAREGEPPVISFQSLIYYLRFLEGYQFFALLFCLFIFSVAFFVYERNRFGNRGFLMAAIVVGWLVITLLKNKDPRYSVPLLGPMMVVTGAWMSSWKRGWVSGTIKSLLLALLCIQGYAINFGLSWLPEKVVLLEGYQGQLRYDWNLYLQNYFQISGPPKREDWKQDAMLRRIADHSLDRRVQATLALIPDLPRFNASNFNLFARFRSLNVRTGRPRSALDGIHSFDGFDYVVLIEGDQGWAYTTAENLQLNEIVLNHPETFHFLDSFLLPSGAVARLYATR